MGKILLMIPIGVAVGLIVNYIINLIYAAKERVFDPDL